MINTALNNIPIANQNNKQQQLEKKLWEILWKNRIIYGVIINVKFMVESCKTRKMSTIAHECMVQSSIKYVYIRNKHFEITDLNLLQQYKFSHIVLH